MSKKAKKKTKAAATPETRRAGLGFLPLMRWLERRAGRRPRIGESTRVKEDLVKLGQDPFLGFPDSDLSDVDLAQDPPTVRPRFLGFFGPFGPLPLAFTREADRWARNGDRSFVRFVDIFTTRFIQLFYRSWSDARSITQFDHPSGGTFPEHLRALTGDAGPSHAERGAVDDIARLRYTALLHGRVKSPIKLREAIGLHFDLRVRLEEFVTSWLSFAPDELSRMGQQSMALGQSIRLGSRTATLSDKITVHLECQSLEQYKSFLPGRKAQAELADLIMGYVGHFLAVDVALWLPQNAVAPAQLGQSAELGWMTAMQDPTIPRDDTTLVRACTYQLATD